VSTLVHASCCLQDYLARLRQIRLQNFNERRMQKANQEAKADAKYKVQLALGLTDTGASCTQYLLKLFKTV